MNVKIIPAALCLLWLFNGCEKKPAVTVRATTRESKKVFEMPRPPLAYQTPASWTQIPPQQEGIEALFQIGQSTLATVSQFDLSTFKDPLANINRWRGQAGLTPVEDLKDQPVENIPIGEFTGQLYDMPNPPSRRLIVAVLPRGETLWFFKLIGPADESNSAIADYKSFLKSVAFN
jgi:hypothetical protein